MTPKTIGVLVDLSRQFSIQTGEGGARYIRRTLLKSIGAKLDALAMNGSGVSGEPSGLDR